MSESQNTMKQSVFARLWQRLEDRANPLLVRTLRQEMRSRVFLVMYLLALAAGSIVAILLCANVNSFGDADQAGEVLFAVTTIAWSLISWSMVPITMAQAMSKEAAEDSWYLLELTGMRPFRILLGYVQSAFIRGMWVGSALLPFLGLSYVLRGVEINAILFAIVLIPLGACVVAAWATFIVSLGVHFAKVRQSLVGLVSLGATFLGFITFPLWAEGASEIAREMHYMDNWYEYAFILVGFLNAVVVGLAIPIVLASAQLTHPAEDRSRGPRLLVLLIIINLFCWPWLAATLIDWTHGLSHNDYWEIVAITQSILTIFAIIMWAMLSLFTCSEGSRLTIRQQQSHADTPRLLKPLNMILLPGGARGRVMTLLLAVGIVLLNLVVYLQISGLTGYDFREANRIILMNFSIISLVFIWLALSDLIFMFVKCRVVIKRIAMFVALIIWCIGVPLLAIAASGGRRVEDEIFYWSPFGGSYELAKDAFRGNAFAIIVIGTQFVLGGISFLYLAGRAFVCRLQEVKQRNGSSRPASRYPARRRWPESAPPPPTTAARGGGGAQRGARLEHGIS